MPTKMKLFCALSTFSTENSGSSLPRYAHQQFLSRLPLFDVLIGVYMVVIGIIFASTYLPDVVK